MGKEIGFDVDRLSSILIENSSKLMELGLETKQKHLISVGKLIGLLGSVITNEEDTEEMDKFLAYFSAKKIVESVSPAGIYLAKQLSENPMAKGMIDAVTDGLMGLSSKVDGDDTCDDCIHKPVCNDGHCFKDRKSAKTGKSPKKPTTPRKRKPKKDNDE